MLIYQTNVEKHTHIAYWIYIFVRALLFGNKNHFIGLNTRIVSCINNIEYKAIFSIKVIVEKREKEERKSLNWIESQRNTINNQFWLAAITINNALCSGNHILMWILKCEWCVNIEYCEYCECNKTWKGKHYHFHTFVKWRFIMMISRSLKNLSKILKTIYNNYFRMRVSVRVSHRQIIPHT